MNFITIVLIIVSLSLIAWIVSSYNEFRKMDDDPENYQERRPFKSVSDGSEEF